MILTPRLRLRALSTRDLPLFRKLYTDAETMRHIGRSLSAREVEPSFRATLAATRGPCGPWFFKIIDRRCGRGIGLCSIRHFSARQRNAEVGMMLLHTKRQRGFATEALSALIDAAFRALRIDSVWVQYRHANTAAARLCNTLGFAIDDSQRSRGASVDQCVRVIRKSISWTTSDQSDRGQYMSNIIGFLEQAGSNTAMRHANREALLRMMQQESITDPTFVPREKMYCAVFSVKPPKKKPAKKKPAKAPPKKKPAKKAPAKKAPAKRKKS